MIWYTCMYLSANISQFLFIRVSTTTCTPKSAHADTQNHLLTSPLFVTPHIDGYIYMNWSANTYKCTHTARKPSWNPDGMDPVH